MRKNAASFNSVGIVAAGTTDVGGNVVVASPGFGVEIGDAVTFVGNSVLGNPGIGGIDVGAGFTGSVEKNNTFGNAGDCGIYNDASNLLAANNYWGAATGPGVDPADQVCNVPATTSPFATKPFAVKAAVKP